MKAIVITRPAPPGIPADIPGLEFAGRIASCGEGVRRREGLPLLADEHFGKIVLQVR